ncbi:integrator complex subunit 3 homolog [Hemicordylus capensis]|uniref:integrator complex subunit 3 homolog n=1 Tax=Hemicordylus capensis TaxID=884348 RepID=UPI0023035C6F|nr:integrator complex subunit 3 homolog [Hemicordylus capensis]XP_053139839.1 integrator complex subunit 3 homolog [Hemicordylus capensis]
MPEPLPAPCITNNILSEVLIEEPSVPEPLPAPHTTNDILEEELTEEPSVPEPLPAPGMTNDILEEELTEEPSVPEPLPAPRITNDILEEVLIEETSMPGPLPTPCITNDLLGKVLIEDTSVPGPSILTDTPKEAASVSEPLLEPSIADNYLQQEVELLKVLQHDYVQQQLRVRRISQQFPRSLRAINLQIGHTRTRLIRSEVRLQRWEREDVPAGPAALLQPSGSDSSLSSASPEVASIPPSTSTSSLLLHPSPPPPPSPPPLEPDLSNVKETLQSLVEMQVHQLRDRQRDLRSSQECLQSFKALRGQLRRLRSRLARVEATMGIVVPPRELDVAEEEGEGKLKETTVLLFT